MDMMDLQKLIDRERAALEKPATSSLNVVLGGELVKVTVTKLGPDAWQTLVALNPPRVGISADSNIGYNASSLSASYPVEGILVDGEPVERETWTELHAVLNSLHRHNLAAVIFGLNVASVLEELQALGKAAAGQPSSSPANRESRRAASKVGSRPKSPRTTTPKATSPDVP